MTDKQPKKAKKSDDSRANRFVDFGDDWQKTFKSVPLNDKKSPKK